MSSGQKPRTPRYWPRMKVRGARRRQLAPWQRMQRAFDDYGKAMRAAGMAMEQAFETMTEAGNARH